MEIRRQFWNWFSPSTFACLPGIKLKLLCVARVLPTEPSDSPFCFDFFQYISFLCVCVCEKGGGKEGELDSVCVIKVNKTRHGTFDPGTLGIHSLTPTRLKSSLSEACRVWLAVSRSSSELSRARVQAASWFCRQYNNTDNHLKPTQIPGIPQPPQTHPELCYPQGSQLKMASGRRSLLEP